MTAGKKPGQDSLNIEALARQFLDIFPKLEFSGQRVGLETYRALAQGEPVAVERIAAAAEVAPSVARGLLQSWPGVFWEDDKVSGLWGLSVRPVSRHLLHIGNRTLYGWCAWDTLFLPQLIGETARVESQSPGTGQVITMTVSPQGASLVNPPGTVLSMLSPRGDMMSDLITTFCHFIFFFPSASGARDWVEENPAGFLMTVEDGFRLGILKNHGHFSGLL